MGKGIIGALSCLLLSACAHVPAGTVVAFAGPGAPPEGWEACRGQMVSKDDAKYKSLFEAIGTAHGGDASPNFQLPDYRGMFLRGVDEKSGRDPEASSRKAPGQNNTGNRGDLVGSTEDDSLRAHAHETQGLHLEAAGGGGFNGAGFDTNSNRDHAMTHMYGSTSVGAAETRPKNAAVFYIIKL